VWAELTGARQIEQAMREFTEAQQRHEAAEKEFVASKLDLHHKRELKEQLTEHLLLIIQEVLVL
jgi:RAB6-interacting golgin